MLETVYNRELGNLVKLVPNESKSGVLDPRAREELIQSMMTEPVEAPTGIPDVEELRASMGWPDSKDISKHELVIENHETKYGVHFRTYVKKTLLDKKVPVVFFYHGGGFFGGSIDNVENPARAVAYLGDVMVVSVDWALAPENPAPMGLIESYQTLLWVLRDGGFKIDTKHVAVMGDSAGGNFAYTLGLVDRAFGTNVITKIVSLYPVTYLGNGPLKTQLHNLAQYDIAEEDKQYLEPYINGFNGSTGLIDFWYMKESNAEMPFLSPIMASEKALKDLPESLLIVGEYDPLRFEGEAMWQKIKLAGGKSTYIRYNGMTHAFMDKVGDFEQADDAIAEVAKFLKP
ncbi:alpha/beta hydrolase [Weissella ceti]|uniref:Alpha/beta hydrolase n=1 Tax=Weissella ceti TaxID=759620 RepID=A0ABT3E326_9LACO|nr:alpha/beta hydrolase fold domain-containing protein [Weissella ceti]MCW0952815.1 alpha/beta hydrolase [Weissella ceti]QVK12513.1 alpha/beta hydrolase fold domain-containing protein [Weissella ceti]